MDLKRSLFILAAVLLAVILVSCTRSLATPTSAIPTTASAGSVGTPSDTDDLMEQIWELATQTALAAQQGTAVQATPQPGAATTTAPQATTPATTAIPTQAQPTAVPTTAVPATQPVVVPSPTPGIPTSYTLQQGEFPYCIARRFNVNPIELLNANNLSTSSQPPAGTRLSIPQSGNPFPGNRALRAHPGTYTVGAGDTINEVACYYGDVSPEAIGFANNLTAPYTLTAGQVLQIP
jgi:LysM repeat protein